MAVSYWNVCVLNGAALAKAPACVEVEEYGWFGYFVRDEENGAMLLLKTNWRSAAEASRGGGTYLIGRWLRYTGTTFEQVDTPAPVARRLLNSFVREHHDPSTRYRWYAHRTATSVKCPDRLCRDAGDAAR
jgi:hypothetical protein